MQLQELIENNLPKDQVLRIRLIMDECIKNKISAVKLPVATTAAAEATTGIL